MLPVNSTAPADRRWSLPRRIEWGLMALAVVAIGWFYAWTAAPTPDEKLASRDDRSYYNLVVRGWLKGQLSLDVPDDPLLASLADPYDPANRQGHGIHDASFYRGKYYLYFGVTPVLLLYLPFHAVTGSYISDAAAIALFAYAGFLISLWLVRSVIRSNFPQTPTGIRLACVLALGLANMVPPLLRRPGMWEVPIICAYALFMLVLYCVWRALESPGDRRWLAAASLVMGLCVGSRPVYLVAAVVLLGPSLATAFAGGAGFWRRRGFWLQALAAIGPIAGVGVGLAVYNQLRFGSPFEFGQTYQLSGSGEKNLVHFSLGYFWFNLRVYLFSVPGLSPYFPFLTVITPPPVPPGQFGMEDPYGIIPGMPWVLFALLAAGHAVRQRGRLAWWCGAALAGIGLTMAMLFCFGGTTGRYEVDFTPGLILVGAVGLIWTTALLDARWLRGLGVGIGAAVAVWSTGLNILLSLQHNRLLELNHPQIFARLAHAFNRVPQAFARLVGHQDGPVEIRLVFPEKDRGQVEPILTTGREFLADYLFVHYLERGLIRFGLEHTSRGSWVGSPVRIDSVAEHRLVVQMGSLYPPRDHPAYDGLTPEQIDARTRDVRVFLDGRTVLHVTTDCYDSTEWQPSIGTSGPHRPGFKSDFSGMILGWRRLPSPAEGLVAATIGKLHLVMRLPDFTVPHSEPLLCTGVTGRGDLIYIRYVDARHYVIGHDHWGHGGVESPVVEFNPGEPQDFDISCPPLLPSGVPQRFAIVLNGRLLLDREEPFYPCQTTEVAIGANPIMASTAGAAFTGKIDLQERLPK